MLFRRNPAGGTLPIAIIVLLSVALTPVGVAAQGGSFGKNKVQYREFDWQYISSEHFDLYFYEGGYDLAVFAADVLESSHLKVSEQLNHHLRGRVPVILYQSHNDFQQTNVTGGLLEEGVGGFTESFKNRMVMPFTGSYEEFRHVLHHELTHAVTFEKLYGAGVGSLLSSRALFRLPLWFAEGFAEYSSRHGWDTFADMVIRDATVHGYLVPLDYVGGYLAYKEGQSALLYLAERYGEEKIAEVLSRGRLESTMDNSLRKAIGMGVHEFNEAWQKRLRREYWPEISIREEPKDFSRQLTDHEKDGSFFNDKPIFSPRGDRLAVLSEVGDYTEVKIISAIDGQKLRRVLKGGRSDRFESLHSFVSGMSFSPDGSTLALIAKSKGNDALFLVNADGEGDDRVLRLGFSSMRSPVFAPDGQSVIFTAARFDRNDLYRVDLATEEVTRLTNDHYDEQDADFDATGTKLLFASDRAADASSALMLPDEQNTRTFEYGVYNIFEADLTTGVVRPLTNDDAENKMPVYSPDGESVCFVSNKNGIYNLYLIDSTRPGPYPITDALSGCFSPSWSPDGRSIAFTAFFKGGFDVFLVNEIRPRTEEGEELSLTNFMKLQRGENGSFVSTGDVRLEERTHYAFEDDAEFTSYVKKAESPLEHRPLESTDSTGGNLTKVPLGAAAQAGEHDSTDSRPVIDSAQAIDTLGLNTLDEEYLPAHVPLVQIEIIDRSDSLRTATSDSSVTTVVRDSAGVIMSREPSPAADSGRPPGKSSDTPVTDTATYEIKKYKRKFSPDLVSGGLGYDSFFGLRGQSYLVVSDYMGDHQIFIVSDLINTIDQSNIQVYYAYRPLRIDYGVGIFHSKYYYIDFEDRLFSDRTYGFLANASRPFSKFTRLQLDGMMIFIDRVFSDPNREGKFEDRFARVGMGVLSLVHDDITWGLTGPARGVRYRVSFEYAPPGLSRGISYQAATADFRQYTKLGRRYSLAFRFAGGVSGGKNAKRFYLGGVDNWIGSTIGRSDVYDVEGLYFSEVVTPFRGYDYYDLSGNRFFVINTEFRFPFVDVLAIRFPLPLVLQQVGGTLFADAGSAWQGDNFKATTSQGPEGFRLKDIRAAFGFGVRANLGFVVLRFDHAWRTDLNTVEPHPKSYFSLGADF